MTGHRITVVAVLDFPDGSRRVMFRCVHGDCVEGHVEAAPPAAADGVVAVLVERHRQDLVGEWLGGVYRAPVA